MLCCSPYTAARKQGTEYNEGIDDGDTADNDNNDTEDDNGLRIIDLGFIRMIYLMTKWCEIELSLMT